jgi:hypothetical protein
VGCAEGPHPRNGCKGRIAPQGDRVVFTGDLAERCRSKLFVSFQPPTGSAAGAAMRTY